VWVSKQRWQQQTNERYAVTVQRDQAITDADTLRNRLQNLRASARDAVERANTRADLAEKHAHELLQRVLDADRRPPVVIQPPPTAEIVKETINGMATVLNGWQNQPPAVQQQSPLSMDTLGFDDRAGVPENMDEFVPPWEQMGPPSRAGWVNPPTNGNYTPYIPGSGNVTSPEGGVE
jgi:uncharacterized membrane protein YccC